MYIEPNSIVKLCANVPLDDSYDHAVNWSSKKQQQQYFESKVIKVFPKVYYQRPYLGKIKVEASADEIFNCNYLMFQNTSYGNKWFYAFVNKVEYSNNNTAVLLYNIDLLTTWHFDYQLLESLVEREHVQNDAKYSNMVAENLDLGRGYKNTLSNLSVTTFDCSKCYVTIASTKYPVLRDGILQFDYLEGSNVNGVYSALHYDTSLLDETPTAINNKIKGYVDLGQEDLIVNVYQHPASIGEDGAQERSMAFATPTDIDGYVPRNNKLFNYPFCFVAMSNNAGNVADFKYELSSNTNNVLRFKMKGTARPIPSVICYPEGYRGIDDDYDSGLVINNFPQCAWVGDTYKAWWAQNKASVAFGGERLDYKTLNSFANQGIDFVGKLVNNLTNDGYEGNLRGDLTSTVTTGAKTLTNYITDRALYAKQIMARKEDLENTPPHVHGQINTDGLNVRLGKLGYRLYNVNIYADTARRLDGYFDRYGYEVDTFKLPSRQNRKHFTFLKTKGCEVIGDMPAEDFKAICTIYDHGVTWWVKPNEVGHYELASDNLGGR